MNEKANRDFDNRLDSLRQDGLFCDVFIGVPGESQKFPVHRAVMASCSHFFRSLFTSGWKECKENEVQIHGVPSKTLEEVIKYAYTRHVDINTENAEDLLAAANRFYIFGLQKDCGDFLAAQLDEENCIGILKFARFYSCTKLVDKCWQFILTNFRYVTLISQEFVQLKKDELLEIIKDDRINVHNEKDVIVAIHRWVDFSQPYRRRYFPELLQSTRIAFVNEEFFYGHLYDNALIRKVKGCSAILDKADELVTFVSQNGCIPENINDPFLRPRIPPEIIFTVSGWSSGGVTNSVESYDMNVNRWYRISSCGLPSHRAYHQTVVVGQDIYAIGGFDGAQYLNSVICLDMMTKVWGERAPMYHQRCYVSTTVLDEVIYACGGFDGRLRHNSAEKYNPQTNQWTQIAPMHHRRSDAGAATLSDIIYIVGGFDGQSCLESAEYYDAKVNQWTLLPSMLSKRSGVSLVSFRGYVYAIGGYDGRDRQRSVERCNCERRPWERMQGMQIGRSNFASVVVQDSIYVIGGYDGSTTTGHVECYNPMRKRWVTVCPLNEGRSAVSACVVKGLRNAKEYTYHGFNECTFLDKDMK